MRSTVAALTILLALAAWPPAAQETRPNIVLAIADDWSFPHAGIYGDRTVSTPHIDRVAREGARFTNAFVASPSCTPSRAALLTGQAVHRLAEGGNLHGFLPKAHAVYPDLLEAAGYLAGFTGKGWGPGRFDAGGRARNPAGTPFKSFDDFLQARAKGTPFSYWFGTTDPHRPYEPGSGAGSGMEPDSAQVPPFLPDTPEVRHDLLDYYFEVQRFDRDLGRILETLERIGELDNTIVIVTSDNGMPFPRAKATVYDGGARVPLAIRWPGVARPGLVSDGFVSLTDLAPTLLEGAGLEPPGAMTGRSLLPLLRGEPQPGRDRAFIERERHANVRRGDLSYPVRAIRTAGHLYVRNFRPDRWPAGDPEHYFSVGPFGDIDGGPSKSVLLDRRSDPAIAPFFQLATAKRPAEELYDLKQDPHQLENVAGQAAHRAAQQRLREELDRWMRETGDPRAGADDDRWDRFPYYGQPGGGRSGGRGLVGSGVRGFVGSGVRGFGLPAEARADAAREGGPNFIVIFTDDQGYGDLGSFGHPTIRTPHLDRMAAEGQRWTSFYVAASVCTPSRAGLLTGRLPVRNGMASNVRRVLFPDSAGGLPAAEVTIAEALKPRGYATAAIGKWHLGHLPQYLPTAHGFDSYYGIPYSNDMDATGRNLPAGEPRRRMTDPKTEYWNVPLMRNGDVVERPAEQATLTRRYTDEAIAFVRSHRHRPFFLYLAHSMPHMPLFRSPEFEGRSARGLYGDVIEEIDWNTGRLLDTLRELDLDRDTLVIFTSDNGPWAIYDEQGGSAGLLRGAKGGTFEGGMRVPAIFWWPGAIRSGVVMDIGSTLDLLPTLAALAGVEPPADRVLDGYDLGPVLRGAAESPRKTMFYYRGTTIQAVRQGAFKAHFVTRPEYGSGPTVEHDPPLLYNLAEDPSEMFDVAGRHEDVVASIRKIVADHRKTVEPVVNQLEPRLPAGNRLLAYPVVSAGPTNPRAPHPRTSRQPRAQQR